MSHFNNDTLFNALYEQYLLSTTARREPSFDHEKDSPDMSGEMHGKPLSVGDICQIQEEDNLITMLLVSRRADHRFQALKVSSFVEFSQPGNLILETDMMSWTALPDNHYYIEPEFLAEAVFLDRVGAFDLMKAQQFIELGYCDLENKHFFRQLPYNLRPQFVKREYELSLGLRSSSLLDFHVMKVPKQVFDFPDSRIRFRTVDSEMMSYSRLESDHTTRESYHELVSYLTISKPRFPEGIARIIWMKNMCHLYFDKWLIGRKISLSLREITLFKGYLPDKLTLEFAGTRSPDNEQELNQEFSLEKV